MSSIKDLSIKQLLRAAALKQKIQLLEKQLSKLLGSTEAAPKSASKKRRRMSKASRAKIAAAAKARWAKVRAKGKKRL
jgi:hypothetical protein